jgi:uncharacterized Zn-binding protein involved in type VI secretion
MPSASRQGDSLSTGHDCVGSTSLATPGQGTVKINGILAARQGDPTVAHPVGAPACPNHVAAVNVGSGTVNIVGSPAARVGDSTDAGAMTSGSSNVSIGG